MLQNDTKTSRNVITFAPTEEEYASPSNETAGSSQESGSDSDYTFRRWIKSTKNSAFYYSP